MKNMLSIVTVVTSVLLIISILLQNQGSGLGAAFGGEGGVYRTKRGAERALFIVTIVSAVVFVVSLVANLLVR